MQPRGGAECRNSDFDAARYFEIALMEITHE